MSRTVSDGFIKLRSAITGRVVRFFEQQMRDDRVKYQQFYDTFGVLFKEAIITQLDMTANVRNAPRMRAQPCSE